MLSSVIGHLAGCVSLDSLAFTLTSLLITFLGHGVRDSLAFFLAIHFITDTSPLYIPRPPSSTFSFLTILLPHNISSSQYPSYHTCFFIVYFFLTIHLPYYASSSLYFFKTLLLQHYTSFLSNSPTHLHFSLYKLVLYIYIYTSTILLQQLTCHLPTIFRNRQRSSPIFLKRGWTC